ncbi:MAG: hypothetical protein CSA74_07480 [Rhodobacterales bacterium]|nr:MAG: hypothetical protein CSA74_07480 [Rhodobacterales bacterium]
MWRSLHSLVGLAAALLVVALALTGAVLATKPLYDRMQAVPTTQGLSAADALRMIAEGQPRVAPELLKRSATGQWKLTFSRGGKRAERAIDLETGRFSRIVREPEAYAFMRRLHRSFTLGDSGRIIPAIGGVAMLILCISGLTLLLRRIGGWRALFAPMKGQGADGLHALAGRLAVLPLFVMASTAVWMSGVTFDLVPVGDGLPPAYPESLEKLTPVDPWELHGLQQVPLAEVQEIVYPIAEDWFDVWAIRTRDGYMFFDQFTGDLLSEDRLSLSERAYDLVWFLHTADGSVLWSAVLFAAALTIPFFAVTGAIVWWRRKRQTGGRIRANASVAQAEVVILVGSETGTTWGFGRALHAAFVAAGRKARLAPMNSLRPAYPRAELLICLAATYGDGEAPESARRFLDRLKGFDGRLRHVTLAFGDRSFPGYCAYAHRVDEALTARLGPALMPLTEIDKQSVQTFEAWCRALSDALDLPLDVHYVPRKPKTRRLTLQKKAEFGRAIGAITTVLRFEGRIPRHRPGDLVAIYPPEGGAARLYSLGSDSRRDGFLEICVRLQEGGLVSPWLCGLSEGDTIEVRILPNERFHMPPAGPVVMIGAGTGIAPFAGMIRQNAPGARPVDLFWGGRDPVDDALYGEEIACWTGEGRLQLFEPAWSRIDLAAYVQDRVRQRRAHLAERLSAGATIMVCGGAAMARAVRDEFDILAAELGTSVSELKRHDRYREDVY